MLTVFESWHCNGLLAQPALAAVCTQSLQTFFVSRISPLDISCLNSFLLQGNGLVRWDHVPFCKQHTVQLPAESCNRHCSPDRLAAAVVVMLPVLLALHH